MWYLRLWCTIFNVGLGFGPEGRLTARRPNFWQIRRRREARAAGRLNHPNVVAVYDVVQAEGPIYFLATEVAWPTDREVMSAIQPSFTLAG